MKLLKIGNVPLPKLYVCDDRKEASDCRSRGVPYVIKPKGWDDEMVLKAVLYRALKDKFPHIQWEKVLGYEVCHNRMRVNEPTIVKVESDARHNPGHDTCGHSSQIMEESDDYRLSGGGVEDDDLLEDRVQFSSVKLSDYIGDAVFEVSIEELQALHCLPVFLDDIATAIKKNIMSTAWMDGWNKKLGAPMGSFQGSSEAPNLIILDTSGSIPAGIASTMMSLIETLRFQADADLIITSGRSIYVKANDDLPSTDTLAYLIGGCNECVQFYDILRKHIFGRHWGNVIVFGDNDAPEEDRFSGYSDCWLKPADLQSTKIDRIMAFHTRMQKVPGYC